MNTASANRNDQSMVEDPESLLRVRRNYKDLIAMLTGMGGKLSMVSAHVDKEFLSSYRVHMLSVQSELKSLKNEVARGEQALNSDAQVAKLETESKWFAEECARLRVHHDAMDKDYRQMGDRLQEMCDQRRFLYDQLKALMKRNKVLQAEVIALAGTSSNIDQNTISKLGLQKNHRPFQSERSIADDESLTLGDFEDLPLGDDGNDWWPNQVDCDEDDREIIPKNVQRQQALNNDCLLSPTKQKINGVHGPDPRATVASPISRARSPTQIKQELERRKRQNRSRSMPNLEVVNAESSLSHKDMIDKLQESRNDAEILLENAVKDVFLEVQLRKQSVTHLSSTRKLSVTSSQQSLPTIKMSSKKLNNDEEHRIKRPPEIRQLGGITNLGLDQFTDNDRFAAIVKFLSHPVIFCEVVDRLGSNDNGAVTG